MANKESSEAAKKIAKAEKEKTAKKSKKDKNKKNIFKAIARFFKDLRGETKKITWPAAKEVLKGTLVTLACIAIIGAAVWLVDLGLTSAIDATREAAVNRTTVTQSVQTTANTPVITTTTTAAEASTSSTASSAAAAN